MSENQNSLSLQDVYQGGITILQNICGIVTNPIELALRPCYGTRYFDPVQQVFTCVLMILLPVLGGLTSLLPLPGNPDYARPGVIGLGTLSLLFLAGSAAHAPRLWRRIFHMELEDHSRFEGPALPFFSHLPLGHSFWFVRVVWEPAFVAAAAIAMRLMSILDRPAMVFLLISAAMLACKNYLSWYQAWLHLRTMMDSKCVAPLLAKAVAGKATEKELAPIHMAGFVGVAPPEVKAAAIAQMAPKAPALPDDIARLISAVEPLPTQAA